MFGMFGANRFAEGPARRAALAAGVALALPTAAFAQDDSAAMIEAALSAAPPQLRDGATVSDLEGNVLREGDNGYTCFPPPSEIAGAMCMDGEWLRWMDAWMNGTPFTANSVGIAYMLAGDSPQGGASNIDPAAQEPTADSDWVVEGPHLMVIVPNAEDLASLPKTPQVAGPYVMWADTPYAHVMVPVDARGPQREVPE